MIRKTIFLSIIFCSAIIAQKKPTSNFSGSLKNDFNFAQNILTDSNSININFESNKKKPFLAGVLSFAIPGAGEFYTENYLKAAIFLGVEVGALVTSIIYNNKGDDQTVFFENYANQHWSAERYARWTQHNLPKLNADLNPNDYTLFYNNGKLNWNELNRMESDIGWYYSHRLAPFGDQQYYEMIGKYSQFNVGWDTFGDENTEYIYGDALVEQFHWYSKERGKANDFYTVAKWAVIAVVSNHFISAFDAAWSASKYNKRLKLQVSVEEQNIGYYKEYYPQLNFSYNF